MTAPSSRTILAIDQGTTSSRALLFSRDGKILAARQKEMALHFPHKGWVEQDPADIWNDTLACCRAVMDDSAAAIGIANQRETTILWDRRTGKPLYNAIVWQDRRTAAACEKLRAEGHEDEVRARTGLLLDPYFSATKIAWILDNVPGARERAERGEIAFGTVDTWLLWNLTGGKVHATDVTNAGRTMIFNIRTRQWDRFLLDLFAIPDSLLPEVKDNAADFGTTALLGKPLPVSGMAGDQQAALVGQACFSPGMVKSTYGTGCFALMNAGGVFRESKNRLLTTPAYSLGGETVYAVEGSIFSAGAAVQWLRDGLKILPAAAESENMARSVADSNGVYFVPAFTGLGAPYWDPRARAAIGGLTRESTAEHIVRAALEAQAYQTRDLMEAMRADTGRTPEIVRADGGLVANGFVCQFIADMLGAALEIPAVVETTALGAAYLAGLQTGLYGGTDEIGKAWQCARRFDPRMDPAQRDSLYAGWRDAVRRVLS